MQITIDFSTHTLIALVSTILSITSVLTIFLLYRTQATTSDLTYYAHPEGAYFPNPYNHLNTAYIDSHGEFVYPTDAWNTGTGDWDTEPSSYYGSGTISHRHGNTGPGSLSTALPLSSLSHVSDVVREDDISSTGTSDSQESTSMTTTPSAPRERTPSYYPSTASPATIEHHAR
ncbi:uncharacterized protein ARMOST_17695 [Armillaria ostoyae]|uniref:Uncharacterized protein n=1 Tax=Armillaria ostoyae TaxID=47428 RepID=A0A284RZP5_ARMOS|nr:uncharacterized protein ARMOST_17695 [Armillaria ostoyae]